MFSGFVRDLKKEFASYNLSKLSKDMLAGVTVSAVALPLALAFGVSNGVSAAAGIVTAIIAGFVIGPLSGASYQISGPTGAMSAVLIAVVAANGLQGVFITCFLAGALLLLAGLLKLGRIINYIPAPVVMGFTSGIAIMIARSQVVNFFGSIPEILLGVLVILIMVMWPKKWGQKVPSSLVSIVVATAVSLLIKIDGIAVVGDIPRTLLLEDRLGLTLPSVDTLKALASPAIAIALLGMIEGLLCGASASRMNNEEFHSDRQLIAQGLGNMIIPFFGGVPATSAIARTSVAIKSGLQTRLTSVFHSIFLLLTMFLMGGVMAKLPLSALAAVLIVTAWRMNEWDGIKYLFRNKFKTGISQFLITMIATVIFDLTLAIVIGVIFSAIMHMSVSSKIEIELSAVVKSKLSMDTTKDMDRKLSRIEVAYITGPIFFGAISDFNSRLANVDDCDHLILSMRGVPILDISGAQAIHDLCTQYRGKGKSITFSGVNNDVRLYLNRAGVTDLVGEASFFWSAADAIEAHI